MILGLIMIFFIWLFAEEWRMANELYDEDHSFTGASGTSYMLMRGFFYVLISLPVVIMNGYGDRYNTEYRRYVILRRYYETACAGARTSPRFGSKNDRIMRLIQLEKMQGTKCLVTILISNFCSDSLKDCILNLMAIHFLTNLDEWGMQNIIMNKSRAFFESIFVANSCEEQQTEADQFYKFFNVPKIERPRISPDHPEIQLMEEDAERIGYLDDDDEHDEANEANETSRALPSP